jgi:asparagine N-glycosylation enzyme membrane subunit Stt3
LAKHSSIHEHGDHKDGSEHKDSGDSNNEGSDGSSAGEEVSFDFSKIKRLFAADNKKRNVFLLTALLILIPVVLTIIIRLQPQYLPATDTWAANSVNNYFRNQIAQAVNSQYPNLPAANKQTLIDQQFADFSKTNSEQIKQQIKSTSDYFKTGFQYQENNHTYTFLGDLDSYFFLRYARNIKDKGTICDEVKDGECWDNHMYAPIGTPLPISLHPYGIFYLYKTLQIFNPAINLMQSSFLLPTFLAVFAVIAAFFVGRKIMNNTAGFFAAMLLAVSPMFLSRTLGSDTDIWNIMFPLIILWMFLEAFESQSLAKKTILTVVAGFFMGLFSFAWSSGWWYIFDFIIVTIILFLGFTLIKNYLAHKSFSKLFNEEVKSTLLILLVLIVSTAVFVTLFTSFDVFKVAITDPAVRTTQFKEAAHADYWPNIQTTVAEMNEASIATIVQQSAFGKGILFSFALLGIIFSLVSKKPKLKEYLLIAASAFVFLLLTSSSGLNMSLYLFLAILMIPVAIAVFMLLLEKETDVDIKVAILLTIWFVGMIFASTKGVRFVLLLIPAFAVALGVTIGYVYQFLTRMIKEEFRIKEKIPAAIVGLVLFILLCMLLIMPIKVGIDTGKSFVPSMTKGWWDSLLKINQESKPDAIINSWWDFGHWFKYVADRAVTVDGSGQDYQLAHWMGTILVTDNEDKAINTIRMLDCGSRNAYISLLNDTDDVLLSVNLTKTIIMQDKETATATLKDAKISDAAIQKTIGYTFCTPPEHFLITSEDMVGKSGVWAHFGYWDFNRAYMIREVRPKSLSEGVKILKDKFGYSEDAATGLYYDLQALDTERSMNDWISPWPNYFSGNWASCQEVNATKVDNATNITHVKKMLACPINVVISQTTDSRTVIEAAVLDLADYKNSSLVIGAYDTATGLRRGGATIIPASILLFKNDTTEKIKLENSTFPYDLLIDTVNSKAMISDPLLSESLFTKLFYLEGRYTTHFEKFSDVTDMTGQRIIIWKINWEGNAGAGNFNATPNNATAQ